jgi:hypothetical protein
MAEENWKSAEEGVHNGLAIVENPSLRGESMLQLGTSTGTQRMSLPPRAIVVVPKQKSSPLRIPS